MACQVNWSHSIVASARYSWLKKVNGTATIFGQKLFQRLVWSMYSATIVAQSDLPKACGTLEMRLKMKELCQPNISHTLN